MVYVEVAGVTLQLDESSEPGRSLASRYRAYVTPPTAERPVRVLHMGNRHHDTPGLLSRGGAWASPRPEAGTIEFGGHAGTADLDRLLMHAFASILAPRQALLAHGAAVAGPHGAIAFLGPSGAGKTTAARNCPVPVLHQDRIAVEVDDSGSWLAPVPFLYPDKPLGGTGRRRLDRILFVSHGPENRLQPLDLAERARLLLGAVLMPTDRQGAARVLDTVEMLGRTSRIDLLETRIDGGFWPLLIGDQTVASAQESA